MKLSAIRVAMAGRTSPAMKTERDQPSVLIKRYGGCRLYDATAGRYISPDDVERLKLKE